MKGLRAELARVGIRGRLADRIVAELDDHLASDPGANLGEPALIADRFAAELRVPKTRRAAHLAFGGLAALALLLLVAQRTTKHAGIEIALPGAVIVVASQVAFVAGTLALWGVRRGTAVAAVQRRVTVAAAAGAVVAAAALVDAFIVRDWRLLCVLAPLPLLAAAARETRIDPGAATAARGVAVGEATVVGIAVVAAMAIGSTAAEHSWIEGVTRGGLEAAAFAAGYVFLGRRLGIRR